LGQKVTVQGHGGITYDHCTGGGIQYLTSCIELDFLVYLCSKIYF